MGRSRVGSSTFQLAQQFLDAIVGIWRKHKLKTTKITDPLLVFLKSLPGSEKYHQKTPSIH